MPECLRSASLRLPACPRFRLFLLRLFSDEACALCNTPILYATTTHSLDLMPPLADLFDLPSFLAEALDMKVCQPVVCLALKRIQDPPSCPTYWWLRKDMTGKMASPESSVVEPHRPPLPFVGSVARSACISLSPTPPVPKPYRALVFLP